MGHITFYRCHFDTRACTLHPPRPLLTEHGPGMVACGHCGEVVLDTDGELVVGYWRIACEDSIVAWTHIVSGQSGHRCDAGLGDELEEWLREHTRDLSSLST